MHAALIFLALCQLSIAQECADTTVVLTHVDATTVDQIKINSASGLSVTVTSTVGQYSSISATINYNSWGVASELVRSASHVAFHVSPWARFFPMEHLF